MQTKVTSKKYNKLIAVLSIGIPILIAFVFRIKLDLKIPIFLPPIYAAINSITAVLLLGAVWAIKKGKKMLHERLMKWAILCSLLFLILYVLYHITSDTTKFGGDGVVKYLYLLLLFSHIVLSMVIIPFVLLTYVRAITKDFERHKQIARYTFPLWLYVAVSGVVVYLLILPYYP